MLVASLLDHLNFTVHPQAARSERLWTIDPVIGVSVLFGGLIYLRGWRKTTPLRHRTGQARHRLFAGGLGVLFAALSGPVDVLAESLASAHMGQHLLLVAVAAPMLAWSSPGRILRVGANRSIESSHTIGRRTAGNFASNQLFGRSMRHQLRRTLRRHCDALFLAAASVHVATMWVWQSGGLYDIALRNTYVHRVEHGSLLLGAFAFWHYVSARGARPNRGLRMLTLMTVGILNTFLGVLLTFSIKPWYSGYANTTNPWGLGHLSDQQLAGAIMWVPGGFAYLFAALVLLRQWLRASWNGGLRHAFRYPE